MEIVLLLLIMGGVGAVIANATGSSPWGGFFLGFLLGPLGWIISALTGPKKKRCGYCGERVLLTATVCKHCGAVWRTPADEAASPAIGTARVVQSTYFCSQPTRQSANSAATLNIDETVEVLAEERNFVLARRGTNVGYVLRERVEVTLSPNRAAPAPATAGASTPAARLIEDLERLAALRDRGVLTEEEFVAKKRDVLGL